MAGCSARRSRAQMWTPVVLQPIDPRPESLAATQPMFYTYALGWDVQDYRGAKIIWHGGAVFGSLTRGGADPGQECRLLHRGEQRGGRSRARPDVRAARPLSRPAARATGRRNCMPSRQNRAAEAVKALQAHDGQARPVRPVACRSRAMPATTTIRGTARSQSAIDGKALWIDFPHAPGMKATLEHWQYDTFRTRVHRQGDRAGLCHFQPRRRRQGRAHHDEGGLAAC